MHLRLRANLVVLASAVLAACCFTPIGPPDAGVGAGLGPAGCLAAGGQCVIGPPANCQGTVLTAYDCNPPPVNPAGSICCLPSSDAGPGDGGSDAGTCVDGGCAELVCCKLNECQVPLAACENSLAAACSSDSDHRAMIGVLSCIDTLHCNTYGCIAAAGLSPACSTAVAAELDLVPFVDGPYDAGNFCHPTDSDCLVGGQCCTGICTFSGTGGVCTRPDGGCFP